MERRIIQDTPKPEVKEEPTIREYSDDEIGIVHTPQTAEEAMSATEEQFLAFVNAQIEKMDKKLLFWGESSPPLAVLNKALMDHSHVLLALTSLYENARIQVSKAKEEYEEKQIEVKGVLWSTNLTDDIIDTTNLVGKKDIHILAIPKGDTNKWEDQFVIIEGKRYHIFTPAKRGIDELVPSPWNAQYLAESYE